MVDYRTTWSLKLGFNHFIMTMVFSYFAVLWLSLEFKVGSSMEIYAVKPRDTTV